MARQLEPEDVDLADLSRFLRDKLGDTVPGELVGRTQLRDGVVEKLGCSEVEAENLVETLIARGFVVRKKESRGTGDVEWVIRE